MLCTNARTGFCTLHKNVWKSTCTMVWLCKLGTRIICALTDTLTILRSPWCCWTCHQYTCLSHLLLVTGILLLPIPSFIQGIVSTRCLKYWKLPLFKWAECITPTHATISKSNCCIPQLYCICRLKGNKCHYFLWSVGKCKKYSKITWN